MATEVNKQGKSELNIQKLKDINNQLQNLEYGQQRFNSKQSKQFIFS